MKYSTTGINHLNREFPIEAIIFESNIDINSEDIYENGIKDLNQSASNKINNSGIVVGIKDSLKTVADSTSAYTYTVQRLQKATTQLQASSTSDNGDLASIIEEAIPDVPTEKQQKELEKEANGLTIFLEGAATLLKGIVSVFSLVLPIMGKVFKAIGDALNSFAQFVRDNIINISIIK